MNWRPQQIPTLMGIINCTPDSFFDGGCNVTLEQAWGRALALLEHGAHILDIGGESTRPGAEKVDAEAEILRIMPLLRALIKHRQAQQLDFLISIDTTKAAVAQACLAVGADMINDISMLSFDPNMPTVLLEHQPYVVLNHIRGTPETMQQAPYYRDVIAEVAQELVAAAQILQQQGFPAAKIILDPGICFSKNLDHNLTLIANHQALRQAVKQISGQDFAWLYGMSRKSYIGKIAGLENSDRLVPSLVSALQVAAQGVEIIRVHDVQLTFEALLTQRSCADFLY